MTPSPDRWAVILAGGTGSRFWPLSTPARPKQMLPLVTGAPLLADAAARLRPLVGADRTLLLTSAPLAGAVGELLPEIPRANIIAEPRAKHTAAALTWAAVEIERRAGPQAVMMSVHADWSIGDDAAFRVALATAADIASRQSSLVLVGIVPARPDPGFGYIEPGERIAGESAGARRVVRFVEKPSRAAAERMVQDGYLWNSGIFVWRVGDFLDEVMMHSPEVAPALPSARRGDIDAFFHEVTPISVDQGVLERSDRVIVIPGDFGWDDVGTWASLLRVRARDGQGNAVAGPAELIASRDNVVHAEGQTVVMFGVHDLVVVARDGLTLVTTTDRAAELKMLLDALPPAVRDR